MPRIRFTLTHIMIVIAFFAVMLAKNPLNVGHYTDLVQYGFLVFLEALVYYRYRTLSKWFLLAFVFLLPPFLHEIVLELSRLWNFWVPQTTQDFVWWFAIWFLLRVYAVSMALSEIKGKLA